MQNYSPGKAFEAKKIWLHVGQTPLNDEANFNMNGESSSHGPLLTVISLLFKLCSSQVSHEVRSGFEAGEGRRIPHCSSYPRDQREGCAFLPNSRLNRNFFGVCN